MNTKPNYNTNNCLLPEQVLYKAEGNTMWKTPEAHLVVCAHCQAKVSQAQAVMTKQMTTTGNPNGNYRFSHPRYRAIIGT